MHLHQVRPQAARQIKSGSRIKGTASKEVEVSRRPHSPKQLDDDAQEGKRARFKDVGLRTGGLSETFSCTVRSVGVEVGAEPN